MSTDAFHPFERTRVFALFCSTAATGVLSACAAVLSIHLDSSDEGLVEGATLLLDPFVVTIAGPIAGVLSLAAFPVAVLLLHKTKLVWTTPIVAVVTVTVCAALAPTLSILCAPVGALAGICTMIALRACRVLDTD